MTRPLVYGQIPSGLAEVARDSLQVGPFFPADANLEDLTPASHSGLVMRAPANTLERHHDVALALRALAPNSPFTILAPKDKGGSRLAKELAAFGIAAADTPKRHHRICTGVVPPGLQHLDEAIAQGSLTLAGCSTQFSRAGG
jgi:16S rRNA (guanine1207-N2)-methyltransferase